MTLYAGPWCGEFGFEIMTWQANVRAKSLGHRKVVVACPRMSEALYADFATDFWPVPSATHAAENTSGCRRCDGAEKGIISEFRSQIPSGAEWIQPKIYSPKGGQFIRYGQRHRGAEYDVVVHARHMVKGTHGGDLRRSTPQDVWDDIGFTLHQAGLSVACIGLKSCSLEIPHSADMRDIPLSTVMDILRSSKVIVGPTSGPIHLAALCCCPQVVWTDTTHVGNYDRKSNVQKLEQWWNPFGVATRIMHTDSKESVDNYWIPDVGDVLRHTEEMINGQAGGAVEAHTGGDPLGTG